MPCHPRRKRVRSRFPVSVPLSKIFLLASLLVLHPGTAFAQASQFVTFFDPAVVEELLPLARDFVRQLSPVECAADGSCPLALDDDSKPLFLAVADGPEMAGTLSAASIARRIRVLGGRADCFPDERLFVTLRLHYEHDDGRGERPLYLDVSRSVLSVHAGSPEGVERTLDSLLSMPSGQSVDCATIVMTSAIADLGLEHAFRRATRRIGQGSRRLPRRLRPLGVVWQVFQYADKALISEENIKVTVGVTVTPTGLEWLRRWTSNIVEELEDLHLAQTATNDIGFE